MIPRQTLAHSTLGVALGGHGHAAADADNRAHDGGVEPFWIDEREHKAQRVSPAT